MAYNLATTELSSLFIGLDSPLDKDIINKKFRTLLGNDRVINELFSNSIGIWECTWYYDSSIKGYNIGDAVWLNTEDADDFIKTHYEAIKHYTDLNSQILNKLPEFDLRDANIVNQYKAAMSGYTDINLGKDVVLPPIFDIGEFSKPIQIAISLRNNNKGRLNDPSSWKTLFVNSDEDEARIRKIIDDKEALTLEKHLLNYHLSGHESSVQAKLSDYLDIPQNTLYYTTFPLSWQSRYSENSPSPIYGTDYVKYFIRKPYVLSGKVSQYQCVRYWNSGMMEHFGTIATDNELFLQDNGNTLRIPFNWDIANDESGAKAYESGELAKSLTELLSAAETLSNMIPPKDNLINVLYEKDSVMVNNSKQAKPFKDANYNITIHPIYQTQYGLEDNYIPIAYGEDPFVQYWNSNYLTNEVWSRKNRSYFTMKAKTRVLPPYISYYAVGKGDL